jgi:XTP/dITP diphosphohydrolase
MTGEEMKIIFASGNKGKLKEAREIFKGMEVVSIKDVSPSFGPDETGTSFLQNAVLKAEAAIKVSGGIAVLSDDSGLSVPALGGEPGVYSSSYGGVEGDDALNRKRLLAELQDVADRRAFFLCTAVLMMPDGSAFVTVGRCDGNIGYEEKGSNGFGYDSLFIPEGFQRTMAELDSDEKNSLSHRGDAFRKMYERIRCFQLQN